MPLASWDSLGARAGYMDWKSRLRIGDYGLQSSDSGTDPFFGGGLEVNFGPSFSIEASYTRFDVDGSDVDSASLGVRLGF
jgi:OOP family OmpA-OmpF porin